ncbi:MAG: RodZ domain-containing protein [Candidatus Zixiibacteriota bacterium]
MRIQLDEDSGEIRSLGSFLKNKRRSKGLSVKVVAEELRIKEKYIKAIEKDQLDQLPTPAHQKIFVKTYSDFLGLDFEELKKHFGWEKKGKPTSIKANQQQKPTFLPVLAGFIIGLFCIVAFLNHMPEQKFNYSQEKITPDEITAETETVSISEEIPLVEKMILRLEGNEDSWVQVTADRDTLFNGILRKGTAWECKAIDEFMINVARSWAVVGFVDGQPLLPFGTPDQMAQKRTITKENLASFLDSLKSK